ncbi:MAG: HIT domain-containing protein [Chloroflexi bacterium]|nr:HIT domain-containing protein [Chloroflexota bacterium]
MDHIYSPWRKEYFQRDKADPTCVFCAAIGKEDTPENLVLYRGERVYVILNRYPYSNGHLMIVPYQHCQELPDLPQDTLTEMICTASKAVRILEEVYHPHQGFNLGMNIGAPAGAGIAGHLHMHVVPRWNGDSNFITIVGQTRVLPETLEETYQRLKSAWEQN